MLTFEKRVAACHLCFFNNPSSCLLPISAPAQMAGGEIMSLKHWNEFREIHLTQNNMRTCFLATSSHFSFSGDVSKNDYPSVFISLCQKFFFFFKKLGLKDSTMFCRMPPTVRLTEDWTDFCSPQWPRQLRTDVEGMEGLKAQGRRWSGAHLYCVHKNKTPQKL